MNYLTNNEKIILSFSFALGLLYMTYKFFPLRG